MFYFAYGSNLLSSRIKARIPGVITLGRANLRGHLLKFHKIGDDGSAKADAYATGNPEDCMPGVLYEINDSEKSILDDIEGVGCGYLIKNVALEGDKEAFTYVVMASYIDPEIVPFDWYRNFVLAGAIEHHFDEDYQQQLRGIVVKQDHDEQRRRYNREVLLASGLGEHFPEID